MATELNGNASFKANILLVTYAYTNATTAVSAASLLLEKMRHTKD